LRKYFIVLHSYFPPFQGLNIVSRPVAIPSLRSSAPLSFHRKSAAFDKQAPYAKQLDLSYCKLHSNCGTEKSQMS
jgi:hypothetical protein